MLEPQDLDALRTARLRLGGGPGSFELPPEGVNLDEVEKSLVVQALERAGGVQTRAAGLLGLHRDQIRYRIEKFGLKKQDEI
jgi:transcriptional regulator with GAF, ATPase, and Fis domain